MKPSLERLDVRASGVARAIVDLQRVAYAVEAALIGVADLPPLREDEADIARSSETFLAATVDTELVGLIAWEASAVAREITRLAVHPSYARRGIGRKLLRAAMEANTEIAVETAAANAPALALYTSEGFAIVKTWPAREDAGLVLVRLVRAQSVRTSS